jgi:hypothetical protein
MKSSPTAHFGLPPCLWVPIAAVSVEAIGGKVGKIERTEIGSGGRVNAVLVRSFASRGSRTAPLWKQAEAAAFAKILHPELQVWVHVDYHSYRNAYVAFGMPAIPAGYFLDHIQNRRAVRARGLSHPYLRLCPVSRQVNTSGGHRDGGEGMEVAYVKNMASSSKGVREEFAKCLVEPIQYADPMDLTKMLNVAPGTRTLDGVRDLQALFYP